MLSRPRLGLRAWLRNERGAAALEFAIVAVPFFMLVLGVLAVGLNFFTMHALEHGVETGARKVRTGEAERDKLTVGDFRQAVCSAAGSYIDCNKLQIHVQHADDWGGIKPQACLDAQNRMVPSTGGANELITKYAGQESEVALITLCYEWDLANLVGFLGLGKNPDGSGPAVLQAATAIVIEPHPYSQE